MPETPSVWRVLPFWRRTGTFAQPASAIGFPERSPCGAIADTNVPTRCMPTRWWPPRLRPHERVLRRDNTTTAINYYEQGYAYGPA